MQIYLSTENVASTLIHINVSAFFGEVNFILNC